MLGGAICDPGGIESPVPETKGLGLLPVHTRFEPEKRVGTVRGAVCQLAVEVEGYFIQHGRVVRAAGAPLLQLRGPGEEDELEGCLQDRVWGTSVHGLFNRPGFRHSALTQWRAWAGKVAPAAIPSDAGALDQRLDEWAAHLRRNMDLGAIFAMAGLESKHA